MASTTCTKCTAKWSNALSIESVRKLRTVHDVTARLRLARPSDFKSAVWASEGRGLGAQSPLGWVRTHTVSDTHTGTPIDAHIWRSPSFRTCCMTLSWFFGILFSVKCIQSLAFLFWIVFIHNFACLFS